MAAKQAGDPPNSPGRPGRVPVRAGLFVDSSPPALVAGRCRACTRLHFPQADGCPYCSSPETERTEISGAGRLWAWTAVTAAPPGYTGEVPYGFGAVELESGIRVLGRLTEADPSRLHPGQPMALEIVPLHDDVVTYAFAPAP